MSGGEGLSDTDMAILHHIPQVSSIEDLAKTVKVPPAILGRELAKLQIGGYIANDGTLTEKGLEAIRT